MKSYILSIFFITGSLVVFPVVTQDSNRITNFKGINVKNETPWTLNVHISYQNDWGGCSTSHFYLDSGKLRFINPGGCYITGVKTEVFTEQGERQGPSMPAPKGHSFIQNWVITIRGSDIHNLTISATAHPLA